MKEEKLFEIVNNVDDDLICEMLEYSPDTEKPGEEYEGVLYAPHGERMKKMRYWKYPAAAAALMLALVGGLFIFNANNNLPYNEGDDQENDPNTGEITTTDDPYTPVDTNIPYEFTEEDKELQRFLEKTADEALKFSQLYYYGRFGDIGYSTEGDGEHVEVMTARFPQMEEALDKQITHHYTLLSDEMPFKTREELEASLKQYYSAEIVSQFISHVAVGEIAENTEEYRSIELTEGGYFDENGFLLAIPNFIEMNGRLYRLEADRGGGFTSNWSMAKVISKTDDELIFSYLGYSMGDIKEILAGLGRLKYEDGWKYDWWDISEPYEMVDFEAVWGAGADTSGTTSSTDNSMVEITTTDDPGTPVDTNIDYEFTEEDKELQRFLEKTADEALKYQSLYDGGYFGDIVWQKDWDSENDGFIMARYPQLEEAVDKQISNQYILLSDELPFKTADELEAGLSLYYSSKIVSAFMDYVAVGEITERTEEYCLIEFKDVTLDENGFLFSVPVFVEINGRLYKAPGGKGGWFFPNWSMAKVISKTDDELIFSYLGYSMGDIKEILAGLGRLKYEDGWKYDWWDIRCPYEIVDFNEVWGTSADTSGTTQMTHVVSDNE